MKKWQKQAKGKIYFSYSRKFNFMFLMNKIFGLFF